LNKKQLHFTTEEWNRFDLEKQEVLTRRYEVILTNHKTKKEKLAAIIDSIDITRPRGKKNLDRTITKIQNGITKFDKAVESFKGENLFPSQKEYDSLAGSSKIKDFKKTIWGDKKTILLSFGICLVIFLIPLNVEARKNIEDVGIALDRTCLALLKANMKTDCPTYEEILLVFPDTTNKRISGDFVFKDGILQREFPKYQEHLNAYKYEKPMTWIDPPADTRDRIKLIIISTKLPYYFVSGSYTKKNNTLVFGKDVYVDTRCHNAVITAEKWTVLLGQVMQHLQGGCKTDLNNIVKIYQEPTKHDPFSSSWYKFTQWLKLAKEQSKNTFLLDQDRELKNQVGEVTR